MAVVLSGDDRAIGSSAPGSVHAISTNHGMGLIADGKTAYQCYKPATAFIAGILAAALG